jgi:hypothetical protein
MFMYCNKKNRIQFTLSLTAVMKNHGDFMEVISLHETLLCKNLPVHMAQFDSIYNRPHGFVSQNRVPYALVSVTVMNNRTPSTQC